VKNLVKQKLLIRNIYLSEIETGSKDESSYGQNPGTSQTVSEVEGQNSPKKNNNFNNFKEYANELPTKSTREGNSDPDLKDNNKEMGSEGQRLEGYQDSENQDESEEKDEIFVRVQKFREKHDRSPDFSNSKEKEEIIKNKENDGMMKEKVTKEDFPSPFMRNELDMDKVEEVFDTIENNVKETTVLYKPDKSGNIRVERYTQTKHADGIVTTEYHVFHESTLTDSEDEDLVEDGVAGPGSGDYGLNPEDEGQNFEEYDERDKELTQGNTGD
jgi:hypothetical protein